MEGMQKVSDLELSDEYDDDEYEDEDEEEEGSSEADHAINGMNDSLDSKEGTSEEPQVETSTNRLGGNKEMTDREIRAKWEVVSGFNASAPIKAKKNDKDGLMTAVCNGVDALKIALPEGLAAAGLGFFDLIQKCNAYIEKKNPWLPTGIKRKAAVVALRNALVALTKCDSPDDMLNVIAMYESFGSPDVKKREIHAKKQDYSATLYAKMKKNKTRNEGYAKQLAQDNTFDEDELNEAQMLTMLKDTGYFQANNDKNGKNWRGMYEEGGSSTDKAIEPVFDILMGHDPQEFMLDAPNSLLPDQFYANFKVLELARAVLAKTEEYEDYLKSEEGKAKAKYKSNFKDLLTKLYFFDNLYDLYNHVYMVIANPMYYGMNSKAFDMLKYSSKALNDLWRRHERRGAHVLVVQVVKDLAYVKEYMEKNDYQFGDNNNLGKLMAQAGKDATEDMGSKNL